MKVLVPLTEGFEEIEAVTVIDVLRRGGLSVVTASVTGSIEVKGAHGIVMKADQLIAAVPEDAGYDAIVLPGGPGTGSLGKSEHLVALLRRQREAGALLAAICAAPTVLTDLGLVEPGVHLTCYPACALDLDRPSSGVPCVEDGAYITGQAPGSALLFSLVVLKRLAGESVSAKVARGMVADVL